MNPHRRCGNVREGVLLISRRVFDVCASKAGGLYRRCIVTIDRFGNVYVRRVFKHKVKPTRRQIVGIYKYGRSKVGVLTPATIADDIESTIVESKP
jgi:hypothetical protein